MPPLLSSVLTSRQSITDTVIIPSTYGSLNNSLAPGTIIGIVLGSVAGFLILLWLFYTCFNTGPSWGQDRSDYTEEVVVKGRRKKGRQSRRASETVEVRVHDRGPEPVRIVRPAPPPMQRTERIVVEEMRRERSRGGSDEIVVIEDHDPPRRGKSKNKRDGRH